MAVIGLGLVLAAGLQAKTGSPTSVGYAPLDQTVEGNIPFTQSVVFTITAPFASNGITFDISSTLLGGTPAPEGLQYINVSPSTLSFATAGEVKQVVVTFTSPPQGVVPPGTEVSYVYQIKAVGWSSAISNPDAHVSINATATSPTPPPSANPPVVAINPPLNGSVYTVSANAFPVSIPFQFTVTSTSDYPVISADALFDGRPISINDTTESVANAYTPITIVNIGTALATGSASLKVYRPGTYSVFARGANSVGPATDVSIFTVVADGPPPIVNITEPAPGTTYTIPANASSVTVPFNFTASTPAGGVVRELIVKVDGTTVPYSITTGALNTQNVGGTTLTALVYGAIGAGNHTLSVTAKNEYGEDTDATNFNIVAPPPPVTGLTLSGVVFLDVNRNGVRDNGELVLPGVTVKLFKNNQQVGAPVVSANPAGTYSFNVVAGVYQLDAVEPAGLVPTNAPQVVVTTASVANVDLGLALDFAAIRGMTAGGYTIGFWKNNLEKGGKQVTWAQLAASTNRIAASTFVLGGALCFEGITPSGAIAVMGASDSDPKKLLQKQLLASEYNYCNGAFFNGTNSVATYAFLCYGEYVLQNYPTSSPEILLAKDRFDAYNNSHGATIGGP